MEAIEEFLENNISDIEQSTLEFTKAILALELQKKEIDDDIKELTLEAKDTGVDVVKVKKVITQLKAQFRTKPEDLAVEEQILELIETDNTIINDLKTLVSTSPVTTPTK
jgi:uncharacterized protein (UPF0335 family)